MRRYIKKGCRWWWYWTICTKISFFLFHSRYFLEMWFIMRAWMCSWKISSFYCYLSIFIFFLLLILLIGRQCAKIVTRAYDFSYFLKNLLQFFLKFGWKFLKFLKNLWFLKLNKKSFNEDLSIPNVFSSNRNFMVQQESVEENAI